MLSEQEIRNIPANEVHDICIVYRNLLEATQKKQHTIKIKLKDRNIAYDKLWKEYKELKSELHNLKRNRGKARNYTLPNMSEKARQMIRDSKL